MIATGTAIALAAMAGAQTGASVYQQKSANKTNKRAQELQSQESTSAAAIERERLAEEKAAREAALADQQAARESAIARDKERWQDYLRINEPYWRAGAGVVGSLYDLAGLSGAPAYAPPTMPAPGPAPVAGGPPVSTVPPGERPRPPSGLQGGGVRPAVVPSQAPVRPIPMAELMQLAQLAGTTPTKATMSGMPIPSNYA